MTREEIIEHLDSIVGTYEILLGHGVNSDILDVDDIEAIKEAISALSENKGDLISRQAVLNTLDNMDKALDKDRTVEKYKELLTECIKMFPSAENKSEWIPVSERLPEDYDRVFITVNGCRGLIVREAQYHKAQNEFEVLHNHERWEVGEKGLLAWQPLPEPYKKGGE